MYATLQNLCTQYGYREISQLLCDEDSLLTEDMLRTAIAGGDLTVYTAEEQEDIAAAVNRGNDALTRQSALMDSRIASAYNLPLPATAIAASPLEECCLALTRAYLCDDSDNTSQVIEGSRTRWIKWLVDLASGQTVIPGGDRIGDGGIDKQFHSTAVSDRTDLSNY
ncbi:MAG: hypothetical protein C9356_12470 [Oleiphilus sp.]|nr:MAG: hypothetical protein C9356_12470 [Oleiphilus sp.]